MRFLHVVESFGSGGVEKFINGCSSALEEQGDECFLVANAVDEAACSLPDERIIRGWHCYGFFDATVASFLESVENLASIIRRYNIDAVIAHPFYSLYPAVIAAKIVGVPVSYVLHGFSSSTFPWTPIENAYFQYLFREMVDHIFVVGWHLMPVDGSVVSPVSLLRNPLDLSVFAEVNDALPQNREWALVSRLDEDKMGGLVCFIKWLPDLPIEHLHIYGNGNSESELEELCASVGVSDRVTFHGYQACWEREIATNVFGVVGLGRVAVEGLALNRPVILLSQESNPCGVVDGPLFEKSHDSNFATTGISRLRSSEALSSQLLEVYAQPGRFQFSERVCQLFSKRESSRVIKTAFEGVDASSDALWRSYVSRLREADRDALFFSDVRVFEVFSDAFLRRMRLPISYTSAISALSEGNARHYGAVIEEIGGELATVRNAMGQSIDEVFALARSNSEALNGVVEQNAKFAERLKIQTAQMEQLRLQNEKLDGFLTKEIERNRALLTSHSWRIGRLITAFPRWVKRTCKRLLRK